MHQLSVRHHTYVKYWVRAKLLRPSKKKKTSECLTVAFLFTSGSFSVYINVESKFLILVPYPCSWTKIQIFLKYSRIFLKES